MGVLSDAGAMFETQTRAQQRFLARFCLIASVVLVFDESVQYGVECLWERFLTGPPAELLWQGHPEGTPMATLRSTIRQLQSAEDITTPVCKGTRAASGSHTNIAPCDIQPSQEPSSAALRPAKILRSDSKTPLAKEAKNVGITKAPGPKVARAFKPNPVHP